MLDNDWDGSISEAPKILEFSPCSTDGQTKASKPDLSVARKEFAGSTLVDLLGIDRVSKRRLDSAEELVELYKTKPDDHPLYETLRSELRDKDDPDQVFGKLKNQLMRLFSKVSAAQTHKVTTTTAPENTVVPCGIEGETYELVLPS